ncbi:hypothetical protein CASFOL_034454 [Castilleja foliolosa]|uniref:Potassium channel SKOR n=1 Tax=Castilleja foliolosa TaxID=1961234 RepID=A0ABD3BWY3_9LAMI
MGSSLDVGLCSVSIRFVGSDLWVAAVGGQHGMVAGQRDRVTLVIGRKEEVRYILFIRLTRVRKVIIFLERLEKDIRINYLFTRILKLIAVELYCTHTAACIFYYLATTLPDENEGYTWIGSLQLGDYSYSHFRDIDIWKRYTTSLYFAIVTMATLGYGDIHAMNLREMIFVMVYYESNYTDASVLQDIPISIRSKISHTLYEPYVKNIPLFKDCSLEFINQIVTRVHEEFFLPGEVIMAQGNEEVLIGADGSEETISLLEPNSLIGEISILCNIPQPYTDEKESDLRLKQLDSVITFHIGKQEAELALRVNSAAYYGDLYQLKSLIRSGADPNKKDYNGRSALHLSASRGYIDITLFLIQERVDINAEDNFGNTPLLEAIKSGHDKVASLLSKEGALLKIDNAGSYLCTIVAGGDSDLLRRVIQNGVDSNSRDYDRRTPLHVAASQGLYLMAKLLVEAEASVFIKDRWGNTPMDEGRMGGNKNMIQFLDEAKMMQLSEFPDSSLDIIDKSHKKKCTVFPFHPLGPKEGKKHGIAIWVPQTIKELTEQASKQLKLADGSFVLSEDGGKILDVDMIKDGQKLYMVNETAN